MRIIMNPGTEAQQDTSEANAIAVAEQISDDLGLPGGSWARDPGADNTKGWYGFLFRNAHGQKIEVDIPGIDPEQVTASRPFYSPRLYVDGNSWLYGYALGFIEQRTR